MIVPDVVVLALVNVDLNLGLVVVERVKQLAARGRQRRVALNDRREVILEREAALAVHALDAQRMRRDVHQDGADVGAGDDGRLDGRPHRHAQIGIDLLMRRLAEPFHQHPVNDRRPRAAADQDNLVDRRGYKVRVIQGALQAVHGPIQKRLDQRLVFVARQLHRQVQRLPVLLGDELLLDAPNG